jgi:oxygen-independent coproporphyrinogen-3 oxidase
MKHSLYIHVPFCRRRCHYCDFVTYAGFEGRIPDYMAALNKEFRVANNNNQSFTIHTIFFGGGTPSLIPVNLYEKTLNTINTHFTLSEHTEITIEANPGTLNLSCLQSLKGLGVNRLSLGVQSTNPLDLRRLDRIHTVDDILKNFRLARRAGFDNINLDLIFGLPGQDHQSWVNTLQRAISLNPEHFSVYSLIIETGTPLYNWHQRGLIEPQDQDLEGEMYQTAMSMLEEAGYIHYEISNWAKVRQDQVMACRHNLQYWYNQPYFGFGVGAHGYVDHIRTENVQEIEKYISVMKEGQADYDFPCTPATAALTPVDQITRMRDFMWLGLRLVEEGVSAARFKQLYGESMSSIFTKEIEDLHSKELVEWVIKNDDRCLRLTRRGIMVANQVFMAFVA